jgi:hypothetical protein
LLEEQLDIVNGVRLTNADEAYRHGHRFGNILLTGIVGSIFGSQISDMLSGYRIMSRRMVKSFPILSGGFEIETELSVHALELAMPMAEMETSYKSRQAGSQSKLRTYSDGFRILRTIMVLVKEERPFQFFSAISFLLLTLGIAFGIPVVLGFMQTGLVARFPTAILATGLVLMSSLSFVCGLILDTVTRGRREMKRLAYLSIPALRLVAPSSARTTDSQSAMRPSTSLTA